MSDQLALQIQKTLSLEELVFGFMRFAQFHRQVRNFPFFVKKPWQIFLYRVSDELRTLIPNSLDIQFDWMSDQPLIKGYEEISFALSMVTTTVDSQNERIRLHDDDWGRELYERFPVLTDEMFRIGTEIKRFFQY